MTEIHLASGLLVANPYEAYRRLRAQSPVYHDEREGTWYLLGHQEVLAAARDYQTFSSEVEIATPLYEAMGIQARTAGGMTALIQTDPPRHTRLRGLVNRAFAPRRVEEIRPWIEATAAALIDGIDPPGPVDAVEAITVPLPVIVISRLLGFPAERRETFKRWSDAVVVGGSSRMSAQERRANLLELMQFLSSAIQDRRDDPGDDLVSALARAEVDGERLSDFELLSFCVLLLVAGNETTTNLMSNLLHILAHDDSLWQRLRGDRRLVPVAVEEALRFHGSVQFLYRKTTRDVVVARASIPAGSRVALAWAAANHDGAAFHDPESFSLERGEELQRHLAFGTGAHYCLGAPLARAEATAALTALSDRFKVLEPAGPGARLESAVMWGFASLPLYLRPAR
jgi:cytochrome P450